jgi:phosphoserine phosphatase RsbU/P
LLSGNQTMLDSLLQTHADRLATLAAAWLATGATRYAIWSNDRELARWPAASREDAPSIKAPIEVGGTVAGYLHLQGTLDAAAPIRLRAEAELLAGLAFLDQELESMTVELVDRQDQLLALYELTQSTRSHLQVEEILASLAREAARLVRTDSAIAMVQHASEVLSRQHPPNSVDTAVVRRLFEQLRRDGVPLLTRSDRTGQTLPADIVNLCLMPIQVRGTVAAALGLINKQGGDFTSPDLKLIRTIAEQAGAQIENLMLYQENLEQARLRTELDLAAGIQLRLLPQHMPRVQGIDIYARSRPALQVGGDFYGFIPKSDQALTFAIGDVAGKGMSAALVMSITHTVLRNAARFMPTATPADIINRVNLDLYDDLTEVGMFVTSFVGHYDNASNSLHYANAGHSPVLFFRAGAAARLLHADGAPMGVLPTSFCEDQVLMLQPGDVLVVATDGFSEARSPEGELFGHERLLALIQELATLSAHEIADRMYTIISQWSAGASQDDDQTLVVIKALSHEHRPASEA